MELLFKRMWEKRRHHQECIMDERAYALDLRRLLALYILYVCIMYIVLLYVSTYRCCIRIPSYYTIAHFLVSTRITRTFVVHIQASHTYSHVVLLFSLSLLYLSYYILNNIIFHLSTAHDAVKNRTRFLYTIIM